MDEDFLDEQSKLRKQLNMCSHFTIVKITNTANFIYLFIKFHIRIPNTYYLDIDRML